MDDCEHKIIRRELVDFGEFVNGAFQRLSYPYSRLDLECSNCGIKINWQGKPIKEKNDDSKR